MIRRRINTKCAQRGLSTKLFRAGKRKTRPTSQAETS